MELTEVPTKFTYKMYHARAHLSDALTVRQGNVYFYITLENLKETLKATNKLFSNKTFP